jgi:hypothetical protein
MVKNINKTIEKIVHIPHDFYERKNVSEIKLLQESGYIELYNEIGEDEIAEVLKKYPHLIKEWLQWSEDNRSSFKWYFTSDGKGGYFVKHFPEGKGFEEISTQDEFAACAAFVKREIEGTRSLLRSNGDN